MGLGPVGRRPARRRSAVAVAGTATGYAYDLRLKTTAWAWLPFAIGLPLLPVYAWVGATGQVPAPFVLLVPLAVLAGAAVALLNGLVDVERDRAAGRRDAGRPAADRRALAAGGGRPARRGRGRCRRIAGRDRRRPRPPGRSAWPGVGVDRSLGLVLVGSDGGRSARARLGGARRSGSACSRPAGPSGSRVGRLL